VYLNKEIANKCEGEERGTREKQVGDRRVAIVVASRRRQVVPSLCFSFRPMGCRFFSGSSTGEKDQKGLILKWVQLKRTPIYKLSRLLYRSKNFGRLGHLPGWNCATQ
jgi:hypothetical protein